MARPKAAFFDFSCCEGCQLQIANFGESLLDILNVIEVVEFREIMSEKYDGALDVAIIEGSINTPHAVERITAIRARSKTLVAIGACATTGGVNGIKNAFPSDEIAGYVYGGNFRDYETIQTMAVHQVVRVDYFVHGCPIYPPEFVAVLKALLMAIPYDVPDYPVCVECKLNGNVCMYDRGVSCLGPVTRAGCNSWCINNDNICYGCRGMVSNPNEKGVIDVIKRYGLSTQIIVNKLEMYNKCRELNPHG
ncbi:cytochrome B [Candidatus Magnetominusculus dajiuhuensis]|uniref:NADH-quinone oxidoreductase subunit B family protein n=1 Tax=Candidatus Magnetominusculus dajiuhuensis TaxID=3137712 RepID=UPI003B43399B